MTDMEEEYEEQDESFIDACKVRDVIGALLVSEGWDMLDKILEEKESFIMAELLDPGIDISDIALREHRMAVANLRSIRMIPQAMLDDAKEMIEIYNNQHDFEKEG